MTIRFESTVEVVGPFPGAAPAELREELSQARVSVEAAAAGGPIHRRFVAALPDDWRHDPAVEIFSRMLWLGRGFYPLSPHYHLDWHLESGARVETRMVLLGTNSRTEFVHGPIELPDIDAGPGGAAAPGRLDRWGELVAEGVRAGRYATWSLEPETLVCFDNRVWHRACPATAPGFRLLLRAIRGLPHGEVGPGQPYRNPGRFSTLRNGYLPETDEERRRYLPYQR